MDFSEFKGFKGKITVVNIRGSSCLDSNNIINETSGSISSPKYPLKYLPSQSMTWCLIVPKRFRVKLTFKAFDLENTLTSDNDCRNDYVEIRDGKLGRLVSCLVGSVVVPFQKIRSSPYPIRCTYCSWVTALKIPSSRASKRTLRRMVNLAQTTPPMQVTLHL